MKAGLPYAQRPYWLWLPSLAYALDLFWADFLNLDGLRMTTGQMWGRDFVNVWTAGKLVAEGNPGILYTAPDYLLYQGEIVGAIEPHFYSYPPSSLFVAASFGWLPYAAALFVWIVGTGLLFLWAARPYVSRVAGFPLVLAALTPAALVNIWAGHYGFLIGALWLVFFSRIRTAPGQAGALAALLTIKPHLGLLIPPLLAIRKQWRVIGVAAAGTILLILGSGLVFGFDLWRQYLTEVTAMQASLVTADGSFFLRMMPSTVPSFRLAGFPDWAAWSMQAVTAGLALYLSWKAVRREMGYQDLAFIAATATFLILPYAFNYDMTVVCLGIALLLFKDWERLELWEKTVLVAGFFSPHATFLLAIAGIPLIPLALLGTLYVQVRHAAPDSVPVKRPSQRTDAEGKTGAAAYR